MDQMMSIRELDHAKTLKGMPLNDRASIFLHWRLRQLLDHDCVGMDDVVSSPRNIVWTRSSKK